jgi:hypothetical protein
MAADWEFFGIANIRTQWRTSNTQSRDNVQGVDVDPLSPTFGQAVQFSDDHLEWDRMLTGAIGATVQAGDIGGKFNIRVLEGTGEVNTSPGNFTELYGTWNFGAGELLVGKTLTPVNFFPSAQVSLDDFGLVGLGGLLSYFKPMLQASFGLGPGNLKFALVAPETSQNDNPFNTPPSWTNSNSGAVLTGGTVGVAATDAAVAWDDIDATIPKIEASYQFDIASHSIWLGGGYQTFDGVAFRNLGEDSKSIDSYVLGLGWLTNWGPFYFNGDVFIGQNGDQYQMTFQQGNDAAYFDPVTREVIDNQQLGFSVVAGWKFNDMLKIEAGYGWLENKLNRSNFTNNAGVVLDDPKDDMYSVYVQLPITVSPGFTIIPEIAYFDWKDNEINPRAGTGTINGVDDEGTTTYFGAVWRITF